MFIQSSNNQLLSQTITDVITTELIDDTMMINKIKRNNSTQINVDNCQILSNNQQQVQYDNNICERASFGITTKSSCLLLI